MKTMNARAQHLRALKQEVVEEPPVEPLNLATRDGSRTEVLTDADGTEHIIVKDRQERALFEYFPAEERCVFYAPTGDLTLRAPAGSITLDAAEGLRLHGQTVDIDGDVLTSSFRRVREKVDILETTAGRIVERARETYRDVEDLAQLRSAHIRHVATESLHLLGNRSVLKAWLDLKLKGKTVHLG